MEAREKIPLLFGRYNFNEYFLLRYWMYGEVLQRNAVSLNPKQRRENRGWFPRISCSLLDQVVEYIDEKID